MQLKNPVHFVCPDNAVWPELKDWDGMRLDDQVLSDRSGGILHSWVLRTYYQLRLAGEPVTLSAHVRPQAINIVSVRDFGRRQRNPVSFVVVPQGDAHCSELANFRILQNGLRPSRPDAAVIWHWTQPGIIPRDPARGARVEQLCYKGRELNLDVGFRSDTFMADLAALDMTFEIDAYSGMRGEHTWNDYHAADAVLAVRNLTVYDVRKKPASKLVNAWFGDLPALLGPEPAYREVGRPDQDYIEVCTPGDVLAALKALRDNPDLFRKIVENGRTRRQQYSDEALTRLWIETLNGAVAERFDQWLRLPLWRRAYSSARGMLREPGAKTKDKEALQSGERVLDTFRRIGEG